MGGEPSPRSAGNPLTVRESLVIATWCTTALGLLEGTLHSLTRGYPMLHAAHKVPLDILWITPLVSLPVYWLAALGLLGLFRLNRRLLDGKRLVRGCLLLIPLVVLAVFLAPQSRNYLIRVTVYLTLVFLITPVALELISRWFRLSEACCLFGVLVFAGLSQAVAMTAIIQPLAAVLLCLGITITVCRTLRGREDLIMASMCRRWAWCPLVLLVVGSSTLAFDHLGETVRAGRLPAVTGRPANVLLLVLDTVRFDRFQHNGDPSLTPNIDRLARRGIRYDNAWSTSSWSLPTQVSILTGQYPYEHGASWPDLEARQKCVFLSEYLAARGYVTGAFSGNSAWITPEYLGQGFVRFKVYQFEDSCRRTALGRLANKLLCKLRLHDAGRGKKAAEVNEEFLEFLDDYPDRPFFGYLCYMDVNQGFHDCRLNSYWNRHAPTAEVVAAYDRSLADLDRRVGELIDELEQRRMLDNTIVVITSDHGESFGQEYKADHQPTGHGTSLYPEQTRVPLILYYPPGIAGGRRVSQLVTTRSIPATVAHLLDVDDHPYEEALPEEDVAPQRAVSREVLSTLNYENRNLVSLITRRWQYITHWPGPATKEELYDRLKDESAKYNLGPHSPHLQSLRERLDRWLASIQSEPARASESQ